MAMQAERSTGIPLTIHSPLGHESNHLGAGDSLLNLIDATKIGDNETDLLNSLESLDSRSKFDLRDDHSELGSLGEESTIVEGKKLVTELHRIQGLLGSVLAKKGNIPPNSAGEGLHLSPPKGTSQLNFQNEEEVERLKAQLHEQAVHTSLRKADSTFLQAQLQEKDTLLKDISQILEAVEKRQIDLETENERLRQEWAKCVSGLRQKESEGLILEKLMKKRENEIKNLKEQLKK